MRTLVSLFFLVTPMPRLHPHQPLLPRPTLNRCIHPLRRLHMHPVPCLQHLNPHVLAVFLQVRLLHLEPADVVPCPTKVEHGLLDLDIGEGAEVVAVLQAAVGGLVVVQRRGEAALGERGAQDGAILSELSVHAVAHHKYN